MMAATLNDIDLKAVIAAMADAVAAHAEELTTLDRAIGDGDHGANMKRGFEAVRAEADALAQKPLGEALKAAGMKLVMTVGGASGPLFGTLFMTLGKELPENPDRAAFAAAFAKAVEAVAARGKSQAGQKTMLDVLFPVSEALSGGTDIAALPGLADEAAQATAPILATRGRASFLGERSVGHVDPGARSVALLTRAAVAALGDRP